MMFSMHIRQCRIPCVYYHISYGVTKHDSILFIRYPYVHSFDKSISLTVISGLFRLLDLYKHGGLLMSVFNTFVNDPHRTVLTLVYVFPLCIL